MTNVTVAALQTALTDDVDRNVARITELVREAAGRGARIILPSELFEGHYFCRTQREDDFARARPLTGHPTIAHFQKLAAELDVVIPVSFFEQDGPCYYNSIATIDASGHVLGVYRKSHIPDGPGYQEKFFFRPGDTGFHAYRTRHGTIGVAICWDQWFPEAARLMAMAGAELLIYPTAIGTWAGEMELRTIQHQAWQTLQRSHAIANGLHVLAINRVGVEDELTFWGGSFVATPDGQLLAEAGDTEQTVTATIDFEKTERMREGWPFFRDRRIDAYEDLLRRWRDGTDRD